jgi:uncharacterized membrane protein (UPF0127 family)
MTIWLVEPTGRSTRLEVLVADTPSRRLQGLQNVDALDAVDGMLFQYPSATTIAFQMLNVTIPLWITWFDSQDCLLATALMQPCTSGAQAKRYRSPAPFQHALEMPVRRDDVMPILPVGSRLQMAPSARA